jgi:hypothetical protein
MEDDGSMPAFVEGCGPDVGAQIERVRRLGAEGDGHRSKIFGFVAIAAMLDGEVIVGVTMLAGPAKAYDESGTAAGGQEGGDPLPAGKIHYDIEAFAAHGSDAGPGMGEAELDDSRDGGQEFCGRSILRRSEKNDLGVRPERLKILDGGGGEKSIPEGGRGEDADATNGFRRRLRTLPPDEARKLQERNSYPAVEIAVARGATLHASIVRESMPVRWRSYPQCCPSI